MDSAGFVHRIGEVLADSRVGRLTSNVFVLDDDIDPADDNDLLWALATRVHPAHRSEAWDGLVHPLLCCFTAEEREAMRGPVVVHDALQPAVGEGRLPHSS